MIFSFHLWGENMKKIVILGLFFFASLGANAEENWINIGKTDESNFYINFKSIEEAYDYNNTYVKSWIKSVIYNDITKDGLSVGDITMTLYYSNCSKNQLGVKTLIAYKNNKPFGSQINNTHPDMRDVIPETMGKLIFDYSCKGNEFIKDEKAKAQRLIDAYNKQHGDVGRH